ncbi:MAG: hypothetical protein MJ002_09400 [Paludibacteraceae bacterium]|nr:hypothetical protein [Paludibacteraceae bacterium]
MQKKHVSPEFTVIKQDEANAKFFVASFENAKNADVFSEDVPPETTDVASHYDNGTGFTI